MAATGPVTAIHTSEPDDWIDSHTTRDERSEQSLQRARISCDLTSPLYRTIQAVGVHQIYSVEVRNSRVEIFHIVSLDNQLDVACFRRKLEPELECNLPRSSFFFCFKRCSMKEPILLRPQRASHSTVYRPRVSVFEAISFINVDGCLRQTGGFLARQDDLLRSSCCS